MCTRDNSRILKWDTMLHHTVDFTFHLDYAQGNVSEPIDQDLLKPRFPKDPVMIFFFLIAVMIFLEKVPCNLLANSSRDLS